MLVFCSSPTVFQVFLLHMYPHNSKWPIKSHLPSWSDGLCYVVHDQSSLFRAGSSPCSGESSGAVGEHPLSKNYSVNVGFGLNTLNNQNGMKTKESVVLILQILLGPVSKITVNWCNKVTDVEVSLIIIIFFYACVCGHFYPNDHGVYTTCV